MNKEQKSKLMDVTEKKEQETKDEKKTKLEVDSLDQDESSLKIVQIAAVEGKLRGEVYGLGDDGNVYRWNSNLGHWNEYKNK